MANDVKISFFNCFKKMNKKSALIIHVFYKNVWEKIQNFISVNNLDRYFDIFITTPKECEEWVRGTLGKMKGVKEIHAFDNKGKDIYPFLEIIKEISNNYSTFCKIHTKKEESDILKWRSSSLACVLGSDKLIENIQSSFGSCPDLGMIGSMSYYYDLREKMYKNKKNFNEVISIIYGDAVNGVYESGFFGGTVFWGRSDIFSDFSKRFSSFGLSFVAEEKNDGMLEHAVERVFGVLPKIYGCETRVIVNNFMIVKGR